MKSFFKSRKKYIIFGATLDLRVFNDIYRSLTPSLVESDHMKPESTSIEIEVKFYLANPEAVRGALSTLGASAQSKVFETNHCYENPELGLKQAGYLLRLRHDHSWRLTFKSKPLFNDPQFKIYQELEVCLEDGVSMNAILEALGFQAAQSYEKWRETYHWQNTTLCIDTMPFGVFMEIEGPKTEIIAAAGRLGFEWDKRILTNYLSIFEMLRQKENLNFNDPTFANFKDRPMDMTPYLDLLYAGNTIS
jgi:adenylate cyclase class 2